MDYTFLLIGTNALLALSIYITLSCAMLSVSNAASAAIGAYTAGMLTTQAGWGLWPAIVAGALLAGLVGLALGVPILRLRGVFLAITTIGFGEVVRIVIVNSDSLGGSQGLRLNAGENPTSAGFWEIYGTLLVVAYFFSRLRGSRMGLALEAIREDESAARTVGINVNFYKVAAYVIGATIAGLAGGLFAHLRPFISPSDFSFTLAVDILMFAVVGGTFSWLGAILGAGLLTFLPDALRAIPPVGDIYAKDYPEIFTGLILLAVILFLPNGLLSAALGIRRTVRLPGQAPEQIAPDPHLSELGDHPATDKDRSEVLRGPDVAATLPGGIDTERSIIGEEATRTGAGPREEGQ